MSEPNSPYSSITHLLEQVSQLGEGAGETSEVGHEQWSCVWAALLMQTEPFWAGARDNRSRSIVALRRLSPPFRDGWSKELAWYCYRKTGGVTPADGAPTSLSDGDGPTGAEPGSPAALPGVIFCSDPRESPRRVREILRAAHLPHCNKGIPGRICLTCV